MAFDQSISRGVQRAPKRVIMPPPSSTSGIPIDEKGAPEGVATLDETGKVPSEQMQIAIGDGLVIVGGEIRLAVSALPTG